MNMYNIMGNCEYGADDRQSYLFILEDLRKNKMRGAFNFSHICEKYENLPDSGIEVDLKSGKMYVPKSMSNNELRRQALKFESFSEQFGSSALSAPCNDVEALGNDSNRLYKCQRLDSDFEDYRQLSVTGLLPSSPLHRQVSHSHSRPFKVIVREVVEEELFEFPLARRQKSVKKPVRSCSPLGRCSYQPKSKEVFHRPHSDSEQQSSDLWQDIEIHNNFIEDNFEDTSVKSGYEEDRVSCSRVQVVSPSSELSEDKFVQSFCRIGKHEQDHDELKAKVMLQGSQDVGNLWSPRVRKRRSSQINGIEEPKRRKSARREKSSEFSGSEDVNDISMNLQNDGLWSRSLRDVVGNDKEKCLTLYGVSLTDIRSMSEEELSQPFIAAWAKETEKTVLPRDTPDYVEKEERRNYAAAKNFNRFQKMGY